ncbi:MAG: hypothetical protein ACXVKN_17550 [Acidimicrobiia bacterium]
MGLRRKRRVEADLIEVVRAELATLRTEVQTTMAETAAVLSVRVRTELEQRMGEPSALVSGIQRVRETVTARDSELGRVLTQVVETCEMLSERVQIDRIERAALVDAVSRLTAVLAGAAAMSLAPAAAVRETVIGGTVRPPAPPPSPPGVIPAGAEPIEALEPDARDEIDLVAEDRAPEPPAPPPVRPVRPDGVEVRCRFGDRWVTGFEVCEVIRLDDSTRYRLRRRSDGSVIPTLFDEKDLRFFSTSFHDPV